MLWADEALRPPLMLTVRNADVRLFRGRESFPELVREVKKGRSVCVALADRALADKLPFPKTTLRAGIFSAVFYNTDFPEMRMRKP